MKRLFFALFFLLAIPAAFPHEHRPIKRVLILAGYYENFRESDIHQAWETIRTSQERNFIEATTFRLGLERTTDREAWQDSFKVLEPLIRKKFYDLIITRDSAVLEFLLAQPGVLRPETPVIGYGYEGNPEPLRRRHRNLTVITREVGIRQTVEAGIRLFGEGSRVAILADATPAGQRLLELAKQELADVRNAEIFYVDAANFRTEEEVLDALRAPPKAAFSVVLSWNGLPNSHHHSRQAFYNDYKLLGIPSFGTTDALMGQGPLGGYASSSGRTVRAVTQTGLEILRGTPAADIPNRKGEVVPLFDYRAIREAGLDPKRLPEEVIFINEPLAFGDTHPLFRFTLLLALLGCAILAGVFTWLFIRQIRPTRKMAALIDAVPASLIAFAADGRILFRHYPHLGKRLQKQLNDSRTLQEIPMSEDSTRKFEEALEKAVKNGESTEFELLWAKRQTRYTNVIPLNRDFFGEPAALAVSHRNSEELEVKRQLKRQGETLRLALQSIEDAVVVVDADGKITLMNRAACTLAECTFEEAKGRSHLDVLYFLDFSEGEETAEDGFPCLTDRRNRRRRFHLSTSQLQWGEDKTAGTILVLRNQTEEYEMREKAKCDFQRMSRISQAAKIGYFAIDAATSQVRNYIIDEDLWGRRDGRLLEPEEWMPEDARRIREELRRLQSEEISEVLTEYRVPAGETVRYFLMYVFRDSARLLHGFLQDVTELKEKELSARNAMMLQQVALDTMFISFFAKDLDDGGRFVEVNSHFADELGKSPAEIIGRNDFELFDRKSAEAFRQEDYQTLKAGRPLEFSREVTYDGGSRIRYIQVSKNVHTRTDGHRILTGMTLDVSELHEKQRELESAMSAAREAARAKSVFLATMSHELRTPLNAVIGLSEILKLHADASSAERDDALSDISLAANALLRLMNDIIDLSKLESEDSPSLPVRSELCVLLAEMRSIFSGLVKARNIELRVDCPPDIPVLFVDELRLRQVLLNLIGNAMKFTEQGFVRLSAGFEPTGDGKGVLTLRVQDTGAGISPEAREAIFRPYVQDTAGNSAGARRDSTGLGLSIVRRLAEKMNAELSLESEVGKGSTFIFRQPEVAYEAAPSRSSGETAAAGAASALPPFTALLVDDVEVNLLILEAQLKRLGAKCFRSTSPLEALVILKREKPDLVFTDIWMPGLNGHELAERIRQMEGFEVIPIFALTADAASDHSVVKHFTAVLLKPSSPAKLEEALRRVFSGD